MSKEVQKKIAVIGSGISGISSAYFLSSKYKVHLFEKNNYLGGHTRTINITNENNLAIDTGFIVFNNKNYPDLIKFFDHLGVITSNSDMSFAVSDSIKNIEYGGKNFKSLFAQYKNFVNFDFLKMLFEIYRFYKLCKKTKIGNLQHNITVERYLNQNNFSNYVRDFHIYPLISSIWSSNKSEVVNFPLKLFINFFNNHDLFNFKDRPQWKYVNGGSKTYINKILDKKRFEISLNSEINDIHRTGEKILLTNNNKEFVFDYLIFATHADQALKILRDPSKDEKEILSKFKYTFNHAYLHSDIEMMPTNKKTWSSWNFIKNDSNNQKFMLTYWMNNLQKLETQKNFFITINPNEVPKLIYDKTIFSHPQFDLESHEAQKLINKIQGFKKTYFCGSYQGYGFHEDGIQSAVYIAKMLDVNPPWKRDNGFYNRLQFNK